MGTATWHLINLLFPLTIILPSPSGPGLFASHEPLELVLAADFDELRGDRDQESPERPGTIRIEGSDGVVQDIPIKVNTRGKFRLQKRTCPDPPLRLNFPESSPQGTVFDGEDKLKLVTHCRDSDRYEQNLMEEYLAYRIYNQLTDLSFEVRLARITYEDTSGEDDPVTRFGFLIEDKDGLADRVEGKVIEAQGGNPSDFVMDQLGLLYLFQFMIGNVDWGIGSTHNVEVLLKDRAYFPIPYDFDWSGLVDAPYAGPNPMTKNLHNSVRERVYWGACVPGLDYPGLFARFIQDRDSIMGVLVGEIPLSERSENSAREYLEEFYDILANPRSVDRQIVKACRPLGEN
jgi:hypothetical protein